MSSLLHQAKQLHALLIVSSHLGDNAYWTANVIRSYAHSGNIICAQNMFDEITVNNKHVIIWNTIIRAYLRRGQLSYASYMLQRMRNSSSCMPDGHTFACFLCACAEKCDRRAGQMIHGAALCYGLVNHDLIVGSAIVSCYSKIGLLDDARVVFENLRVRDLVTWNTIISGYGYCGSKEKVLELLWRMRMEEQKPDEHTFVALLSSFWDGNSICEGEAIHGLCFRQGYNSYQHVASALVSMYMRCGCIFSGYQVFKSLSKPDLVMWSALITGLLQLGKYVEAMNLFKEMNNSGQDPDSVIIASALSACATVAAIRPAKEVHCYAIRHQLYSELAVSSALVDAYVKCGFPELGLQLLEFNPKKNSVTYNALIAGLGSHGLVHEAFSVFERMLVSGLSPDHATFSALLCTCCHSGLVQEGCKFFQRMKDEFYLEARMEHYLYIVKLLAMSGQLKEAYNLIQTMSFPPDFSVWGALLWGCGFHEDLDMGKVVAQKLLEMNPHKAAYRVMISNLYASEKNWVQVNYVRDQMMSVGSTKKIPGLSWS